MSYEIRLEHRPGRPLAVVRRLTRSAELAQVVPAACGLVWQAIRAQQVTGVGRHVAIYWDDQIHLEVGVELDAPFAGVGEVVGSTLPAGRVACTIHYGPYGRLGEAHQAVQQWCRQQGQVPAGPSWELYGHWQEAWNRDPAQISTEVCYLLADA